MNKIKRGKSIRLYPNEEQKIYFAKCFGCSRWLWNQILSMESQRFENGGTFVKKFGLNYILTTLKKEYAWLSEVDSTCLTSVSDDISSAYSNFFAKRASFPKYKSKRHEQSFTIKCVNRNIQIVDDRHIRLPKIGYVYFRSSCIPSGIIKNVTIRLKPSGKYIASVLFETEVDERPKTNKICGCDLGLKELAILDDGTKIPLPRFDKDSEKQLIHWQRLASRRLLRAKEVMKEDKSKTLLDFKNYQKAREMVAKYNEKIANQRENYLHVLSTWLVTNYDVIVLEDLKSKLMLKNHKLARAISNAGWNKLIRMIQYKCEWYGKTFVQVDATYTSQTCNACGCINNRLGYDHYGWLKVRSWQCPDCGAIHDRDINAAINIKNKGLMQLA